MTWSASQFLSYHAVWCCLFVIVAWSFAYVWRFRGVLAGHFVIAATIFWLDNQWIETAMAAPGWDGSPDRDMIFSFGIVLRILLINTALLPVSLAALLFASRERITEVFFSPLSPVSREMASDRPKSDKTNVRLSRPSTDTKT